MNSIISQTKKTIAIKKKQIEENRLFINNSIFSLNDKVRENYGLQMEIDNMESDLYSFEKSKEGAKAQVPYLSHNDCAVAMGRDFPGIIKEHEKLR